MMKKTFKIEGYLMIGEVAQMLGLDKKTLREWELKGKLKAYRFSKNNYRIYKIEDIQNLLQEMKGNQ